MTKERTGDGWVMVRLENSQALLGSRNYAQLVLHLKHVRVYAPSPSAVFLTPMALLTSARTHVHIQSLLQLLYYLKSQVPFNFTRDGVNDFNLSMLTVLSV